MLCWIPKFKYTESSDSEQRPQRNRGSQEGDKPAKETKKNTNTRRGNGQNTTTHQSHLIPIQIFFLWYEEFVHNNFIFVENPSHSSWPLRVNPSRRNKMRIVHDVQLTEKPVECNVCTVLDIPFPQRLKPLGDFPFEELLPSFCVCGFGTKEDDCVNFRRFLYTVLLLSTDSILRVSSQRWHSSIYESLANLLFQIFHFWPQNFVLWPFDLFVSFAWSSTPDTSQLRLHKLSTMSSHGTSLNDS